MQKLETITDKKMIENILALATGERVSQVELLRYLGELAERKLFLGLGYSSLWDYCRRALGFSESVSQQRIVVAKAARTYPALLDMLHDGRLTLCTAADVVPLLNDGNADEILAAAAGKSRREIQNLGVGGARKAVERDVIRRVGVAKPAATAPLNLLGLATTRETRPAEIVEPARHSEAADESTTPNQQRASHVAPLEPARHTMAAEDSTTLARQRAPRVAPSEPVRHRVAFTASADVVAKLEKLQELMGDATLEEVVGKAAELLLGKIDPAQRHARREARHESRRAAEANEPCKRAPTPAAAAAGARRKEATTPVPAVGPRHPGAALRDRVLVAAGRQCEFVSTDGVRCTETRYLSLDHVRPYALGGTSTEQSNLRCLCMAHNLYFARLTFGEFAKSPSRNSRRAN